MDGGRLVGRATQDTKCWHVLFLKPGWKHIGVYLIILYNLNIYVHHFVYMKDYDGVTSYALLMFNSIIYTSEYSIVRNYFTQHSVVVGTNTLDNVLCITARSAHLDTLIPTEGCIYKTSHLGD